MFLSGPTGPGRAYHAMATAPGLYIMSRAWDGLGCVQPGLSMLIGMPGLGSPALFAPLNMNEGQRDVYI